MSLVEVTLALGLFAGASTPVSARQPEVSVAFENCDESQSDEMRHLVALELGATLTAAAAPNATRGLVLCKGDLVELTIVDPNTSKTLHRSVRLTETGAKGRSRLIALALSELVMASWSELASNPRPTLPPAEPAASPEARAASLDAYRAHAPSPVEVSVNGLARHFFLSPGLLWGGSLRLDYQQAPSPFVFGVDLAGEHQQTPNALGHISIDSMSLAPSAQWDARFGIFAFRMGLAIRVGVANVAGHPNNPAYVSAAATDPWAGAALLTSVGVSWSRFFARLALEAGYTWVSIQTSVENQSNVGLNGPWLAVMLGVGYLP
jgi:hypothetical protein